MRASRKPQIAREVIEPDFAWSRLIRRCCRIGEACLIDSTLTSLLQRSTVWPMRQIPAVNSDMLDAKSEAVHVSIG